MMLRQNATCVNEIPRTTTDICFYMVTGFFAFAVNWTTKFMYIGVFINNHLDVQFRQISMRDKYNLWYSTCNSEETANFNCDISTLGQIRELECVFHNNAVNYEAIFTIPYNYFGKVFNFAKRLALDGIGEVVVSLVPSYHWTNTAITLFWEDTNVQLIAVNAIF